jgi:hypothetical protein
MFAASAVNLLKSQEKKLFSRKNVPLTKIKLLVTGHKQIQTLLYQ